MPKERLHPSGKISKLLCDRFSLMIEGKLHRVFYFRCKIVARLKECVIKISNSSLVQLPAS